MLIRLQSAQPDLVLERFLVRHDPAAFKEGVSVELDNAASASAPTVLALAHPKRFSSYAPDVPTSVGGLIGVSYGALLAALFVATAGSLSSIFAIVIAAVFMAVFFTVPGIFFSVENEPNRRPSLSTFVHKGMATYTGHSSGSAALVQMLIVPVFLTMGVICIGVIIAITG